jgi:hypothetical protein
MFKGIKGAPSRTPRTIAEEKGTAAAGFVDETYDEQAGVPMAAKYGAPGQHYADAAAGAGPMAAAMVAKQLKPFR